MCFNVVVINPRKRDIRVSVMNMLSYASYNRDGFSIYTVNDNKEKVYRTLDFKSFTEFVKHNIYNNELVHMHFRMASSGTVSLKNVHMWKLDEDEDSKRYYYVSHNGTVSRYSNISYLDPKVVEWYRDVYGMKLNEIIELFKEDVESDTLAFIRSDAFHECIFGNLADLDKVLNEASFYGVMFLTNPNEVIAISYRKPMYVVVSNSVLYFSNTDVEKEVSRIRKIYGLNFRVALSTVITNQVVVFDVKRMNVKKTFKLNPPKKEEASGYWYYHNGTYYWVDE
jgi:predicted glutamine amidotransferase